MEGRVAEPGSAINRRREEREGDVYSFPSSVLLLKHLPGEALGVVAEALRRTSQESCSPADLILTLLRYEFIITL